VATSSDVLRIVFFRELSAVQLLAFVLHDCSPGNLKLLNSMLHACFDAVGKRILLIETVVLFWGRDK